MPISILTNLVYLVESTNVYLVKQSLSSIISVKILFFTTAQPDC